MMAHPFMPMTNKILKKLTRAIKDSDHTIKSPDLPDVFETQEPKSTLEINPQRSETNQCDIRTDNRYKSKPSNHKTRIIWEQSVRSMDLHPVESSGKI
jgi:hypothetical protein